MGTVEANNTWEDCNYIGQQFPNFNLEDKVVIQAEGIVTKPLKAY